MRSFIQRCAGFWQWFISPPSSAALMRRAAWALWATPLIFGWPLLLPILEPRSLAGLIVELWPAYLLVFALPFALAGWLWRRSRSGGG